MCVRACVRVCVLKNLTVSNTYYKSSLAATRLYKNNNIRPTVSISSWSLSIPDNNAVTPPIDIYADKSTKFLMRYIRSIICKKVTITMPTLEYGAGGTA